MEIALIPNLVMVHLHLAWEAKHILATRLLWVKEKVVLNWKSKLYLGIIIVYEYI